MHNINATPSIQSRERAEPDMDTDMAWLGLRLLWGSQFADILPPAHAN